GHSADVGGGNVLLDSEWYTGNGGGFGPVGEQFVIDGSWTKLRELSLTYDLPTTLISKAKLSNASIGVTGRNLFILSPFPNVDPELNLTGASKGRGLDYFTNPGTGSYMLTVKLGF
ncbi:MAG: SusC/RagA family TonB-linked outer membrane protein, partial [Spirosomataceae bacterium]